MNDDIETLQEADAEGAGSGPDVDQAPPGDDDHNDQGGTVRSGDDIGYAIGALHEGYEVARRSWDGNIVLLLTPDMPGPINKIKNRRYSPIKKYVGGSWLDYHPTQEDLLSTDWFVVGKPGEAA